MSRRTFHPGDERACRHFARTRPGWVVRSRRLSRFVTQWWVETSPAKTPPARFFDWAIHDPELI